MTRFQREWQALSETERLFWTGLAICCSKASTDRDLYSQQEQPHQRLKRALGGRDEAYDKAQARKAAKSAKSAAEDVSARLV